MLIHDGDLLMNGEVAPWPPRDINGAEIVIGCEVIGKSTLNLADRHRFIVGGLRLQYRGTDLGWVVCSYDDDSRYFESWSDECVVSSSWATSDLKRILVELDG